MFPGLSLSNQHSLEIFFGCLGLALLLLVAIYYVAKKFLHGDYLEVPETGDEEEEKETEGEGVEVVVSEKDQETYSNDADDETSLEKEDISKQDSDKVTPSNFPYGSSEPQTFLDEYHGSVAVKSDESGSISIQIDQSESQKASSDQSESLKNEGSEKSKVQSVKPKHRPVQRAESSSSSQVTVPLQSSFDSVATISVFLERKVSLDRLMGCIRTLKNISLHDPPDIIRFHVKILPQSKPRDRTKWMPTKSESLDLDFSLRPLKDTVNPKSYVCIRMYGKKRRTGIMREKCYGECFVAAKTLLECGGVLDADIYLTPKPVKGRFSPMP